MDEQKQIRAITLWGAFWNFVLVVLKLAAGILGNSHVLIADAVHSLSDFLTDLVVLVGAKYWTQPADDEHPFGHGKIEALVTIFVGLALMVTGGKLVYDAVLTLRTMLISPKTLAPAVPGILALEAAIASIVIKETLYQVTAKVGQHCHSSAVIANAWHHRTDALSSIPAGIAVACVLWLGPSYAFLDPAGTIVVSFMIFYAAWMIVYPCIGTLLDAGVSAENIEKIREIVLSCPPASEPHKIRTRSLGASGLEVDLHIRVNGDMTVRESHALSHQIEKSLLDSDLRIVDVVIHIEPIKELPESAKE